MFAMNAIVQNSKSIYSRNMVLPNIKQWTPN